MLQDYTDGENATTPNSLIAPALGEWNFDLLCFDASSMAHLEALYEYRGCATHLLASEALVPQAGYPFGEILAAWVADFPLGSQELGELFVDKYQEHYAAVEESAVTAVFDAAELDALTAALAALAAEVTDEALAENEHVKEAIASTFEPQSSQGERDLLGFLEEYRSRTGNPTIAQLIDDALASLESSVLYCQQHDLPEANGLPIYLPSTKYFSSTLREEYRPLAFNRATGWLEMLEATGVPSPGDTDGLVFSRWQPNDKFHVEWSDPALAVDPVLTDPEGNTGWPANAKPLEGVIAFSKESTDTGEALEWGRLLSDVKPGCFIGSLRYDDPFGPPSVTLHMFIASDMGPNQYDLGFRTVANGAEVPFAMLLYNDGYFGEAEWKAGDRVEISWSSTVAEFDLKIEDPQLRVGTCAAPEPLAGIVEFSADSADSGEAREWGRLLTNEAYGAYIVSVTYIDFDGFPPETVTAAVDLYDAEGMLKKNLGSVWFDGLAFGRTKQGAVLTRFTE